MSASLLDSLTALITPDLASRAASMLGESDSSIRKGLGGALPVMLSGLASRAGDPGFAGFVVRSRAIAGQRWQRAERRRRPARRGTSSPMMGLGGKLLSIAVRRQHRQPGQRACRLRRREELDRRVAAQSRRAAGAGRAGSTDSQRRPERILAREPVAGSEGLLRRGIAGTARKHRHLSGGADPRARGVRGATAGTGASLVDLALAACRS